MGKAINKTRAKASTALPNQPSFKRAKSLVFGKLAKKFWDIDQQP
ncbi:hypothetical protein NON20_05160 [Synechocystis sp. B12]|nr:hypothetical protein NON20_05160 [Synechocystis sp. B12]